MGAQSSGGRHSRPLRARLLAGLRSHPKVSLLTVAAVACAAFVAASVLWRGHRGEVAAVLEAVARAVRDGDVGGVMEHVSPYFSADGMDRESLRRMLAGALRNRPLTRASLSIREIQVAAGRAGAKVHVSSHYGGSRGHGSSQSEWFVVLERLDSRWLIRDAQPVWLSGGSAAGLRSVLMLAP